MAKLFLTSIDLNGNELLNGVLHNLTALPSNGTGKEGQVAYFDDYLRYKGKTKWETVAKADHTHAEYLTAIKGTMSMGGTGVAFTLTQTKNGSTTTVGTIPFSEKIEGVYYGGIMTGYQATALETLQSMFELVTVNGKQVIKATKDFYSVGGISAYGFAEGTGGGSGSSFERLDAWVDYTSAKAGWVLSALLGNDLNTRLTSLESGAATGTPTITGSGNAFTNVTKSGNTLTFEKEITFATLGTDGKVPANQLPSFVDDVLEYTAKANFPTPGEAGKIYVDTTTNKTYRWGGTSYVEISESLALGTTASTAFRGDYGNTAYQHAVAKGSAFSSGLYKITTNAHGHVTGATAVAKSDITALGIPGQDTVYSHPAGDGNLHVPATGTSNNGKFLKAGSTAGSMSWASLSVSDITGVADGLARKKTGTISNPSPSTQRVFEITHGLGNKYLVAQVKKISDGEVVECDIKVNSTKVIFEFNVAPADSIYEYTIIG